MFALSSIFACISIFSCIPIFARTSSEPEYTSVLRPLAHTNTHTHTHTHTCTCTCTYAYIYTTCCVAQINGYKPSEAERLKALGNKAYKEANYNKVRRN
jgi:hypothetical protein